MFRQIGLPVFARGLSIYLSIGLSCASFFCKETPCAVAGPRQKGFLLAVELPNLGLKGLCFEVAFANPHDAVQVVIVVSVDP